MKIFITLLCLLLCLQQSALIAQDFRLFIPGQEKQYYRDGDRIYSPEITSIEQTDSSTIINYGSLTILDMFSTCYENRYPDIFGKMVSTFDIQGINGYLSYSGPSTPYFLIRTNANVGESWDCVYLDGIVYQIATCKSIEPEIVNGSAQLVMTIGFDGGYCDMKISQHDGIISTPAWNRFGFDMIGETLIDNPPVECLARIWDEARLEKFNVPFGELASNLQIGDILHIEESYSQIPVEAGRKLIKATFLGKTFDTSGNSFHLSFSQEVDEWKNTNGQITQSTYLDTAISIIGRDMLFDSREFEYPVPLNRIFNVDGFGEFVLYALFNEKLSITKSQLSFPTSEEDDCFPFIFDAGEGFTFIDGLGGPYYNHQVFYPRERNLKYYKKGDEEWGDPFTFTVATREKVVSEQVNVFPNPVAAGSALYLQLSGSERDSRIQLLDIHGKSVQNWSIDSSQNQQVVDLDKNINPGLYILWIDSHDGNRYYSKVLIK